MKKQIIALALNNIKGYYRKFGYLILSNRYCTN